MSLVEVRDLRVELGDHVTKGQVLAVVRSGEIADVQNQNANAGTDLAIARKNLSVAEDQFKAGLAAERARVTPSRCVCRCVSAPQPGRRSGRLAGPSAAARCARPAPRLPR